MNPRILIALVLVAVFALGATVLAASGRDEEDGISAGSPFEGAVMPAGLRAPDFDLRTQDGERVAMRGLRGRPVLVSFLYTTCEDTCPVQAQTMRGALDDLGHDVPVVAVSVDPANDTPRRARTFALKQGMQGRMRWALGSAKQLQRLWRAYGVQPQSRDAEHTASTVLLDGDGVQRVGFAASVLTPEGLAHDIAALERERSAS